MKVCGYYYQPAGELTTKTAYYGLRYNKKLGNMSNTPLGLQVLIDFIGSMMWINIKETWLAVN